MSEQGRPHRSLPARARFAIATTGLILLVGLVMLAVVYIAMRYVPTYNLTQAKPVAGVPMPHLSQTTAAAPPGSALVPVGGATLSEATPAGIVISNSSDVLSTLIITSGISLLVIGGLGAVLSWIIAGRMLRPLESLAAAAERTASGSLSHRVALVGPDDEFTRLSRSFDDMLDRLERSFTDHERFAANASHELRTPLVTTKALLDLGRDGVEPAAVPALLERLSETNDRSLGIVEAMLDLSDVARTDIGTSSVDLRDVIETERGLVADEAAASGVVLTTDVDDVLPTTAALGNAPLLHRLVANLLLNAVRHNDDRGEAQVSLRSVLSTPHTGAMMVLRVENTGGELSDAQMALLREPFYRVRGRVSVQSIAAPQHLRETHGLGLALVANIVDVHSGTLDLDARPGGGLIATVRLPATGILPATGSPPSALPQVRGVFAALEDSVSRAVGSS